MQRRDKWWTINDGITLHDLELSYSNPTDKKMVISPPYTNPLLLIFFLYLY